MRYRLGAVLPAAVSIVSLAAVVWWATRQEAPTMPGTGTAAFALAVALALYAAASLARGERWHQVLARAGVSAAREDTYRLTAVGYMGNNVLPARGGDVLRPVLLAAIAAARKRVALGTVVAERVLDAVALALIFLVVAVGVLPDADVPGGWVTPVAVLAAGLGLAAAAVLLARAFRGHRVVEDFVRPAAAATRALLSVHGAGLLVLSLVLWTLEALVYYAVAEAVELGLDPLETLYLVALTNLFALVPAAPGYVGTFDAAVLFGTGSLGADGSEALAYLILLRFVLFVPITLVGLWFLLTRYGGWSRYRTAAHGGDG
jgi:glycosyltransferase 2 family protein